MPDFLHNILNGASYNRGGVLGALLLSLSVFIPSCAQFDGEVRSSQSGELLSSEGLKAEFNKLTGDTEQMIHEKTLEVRNATAELEWMGQQYESASASYLEDLEAANAEIEARNAMIGDIGETLLETVPAGSVAANWIPYGLTALTGGLLFDNRRKDRKIKQAKAAGE